MVRCCVFIFSLFNGSVTKLFKTRGGATVVDAMILLLRAALKDKSNQHFVFFSEKVFIRDRCDRCQPLPLKRASAIAPIVCPTPLARLHVRVLPLGGPIVRLRLGHRRAPRPLRLRARPRDKPPRGPNGLRGLRGLWGPRGFWGRSGAVVGELHGALAQGAHVGHADPPRRRARGRPRRRRCLGPRPPREIAAPRQIIRPGNYTHPPKKNDAMNCCSIIFIFIVVKAMCERGTPLEA